MPLMKWQPAMNRLLSRTRGDPLLESPPTGSLPLLTPPFLPIDLIEREQEVEIRLVAPGYHPEEIEILVEGDILAVRGGDAGGRRAADERLHPSEPRRASLQHTVYLPDHVDAGRVMASYQDGLLTLCLPKRGHGRSESSGFRNEQESVPGGGARRNNHGDRLYQQER